MRFHYLMNIVLYQIKYDPFQDIEPSSIHHFLTDSENKNMFLPH